MPLHWGNPIDQSDQRQDSAGDALDPKVMRATVGDDPETIRELVQEFVPAARSDIAEIHAAVTSVEADKVRSASHKLKGSSGLVGARKLVELCRKLEAAGDSGDWPAIGVLAAGLDRIMQDIEVAAERYLENLG